MLDRRHALGLGLAFAVSAARSARANSIKIPEYYLYFDANAATMPKHGLEVVQAAKDYYDWARSDPDWSGNAWCQVIGGIDGAELAAGRQSLARLRAAHAMSALQALGVPPARLRATIRPGYQPFAPALPNTAEPFNRGVMIWICRGMAPL